MTKSLTLALVLSTLPAFAQDMPGSTPQESDTTFRSEVRLVSVYATVTDKSGGPVADLKKDEFRIEEDGQPQQLAVFEQESGRPLSIVLAIDTSSSVRKDIKLEMESARKFVRSILRPVDALALYQFSETVSELVPFTHDLKRVNRGIDNIHLGSGTALFDAIYLGGIALAKRNERKVMVVITDGGDTLSAVKYQEAVRSAQQAEAILYSIIVVPVAASAGRNLGGEHALVQLSRDTGGKFYYADSIASLDAAFEQISRELRTQYLLAYYPARKTAGPDFHRIQVTITRKDAGLQVHHRTGYFTSKLE
ncbi:MAG: VWA domain-containing protein [Acidobacteriales bacterium]|nr:VWA domain-containing protein [Terriglobales bacterium]